MSYFKGSATVGVYFMHINLCATLYTSYCVDLNAGWNAYTYANAHGQFVLLQLYIYKFNLSGSTVIEELNFLSVQI